MFIYVLYFVIKQNIARMMLLLGNVLVSNFIFCYDVRLHVSLKLSVFRGKRLVHVCMFLNTK